MRIRILLECSRMQRVPIDHHDLLRGAIYRWLEISDAEFARQTHDEGYGDGARKLKLFTYSLLRVPRSQRRLEAARDTLAIAPGRIEWWITSPKDDFLRHEIQGLIASRQALYVGDAAFRVVSVEAHPTPTFASPTSFICLTPIVASVPDPEGGSTARFLTHEQPLEFSEAVRKNLLRKHALVNGQIPKDDSLSLTFADSYISAHRPTKLRKIRGISIRGIEAPFTLTGSPELMQTAWECGLGEKNGCGFGMVEISNR